MARSGLLCTAIPSTPSHQQCTTTSQPAAPHKVCPARRCPVAFPGAHTVGAGAKLLTGARGRAPRAPPHQAHYVAWPGSTQQSIETYFHGKIRSIFGFWVAEIAQAPTVMQLPICLSFLGGRAATGLHLCPQAPPAWGELGDTAGPRQCHSPAATTLQAKADQCVGNQQRKGRGPSQTMERTK